MACDSTPSNIGADNALKVADTLNAFPADDFALYVKTKNFHWHVSGPHFRDYHLLLDDQASQIFGVTDQIAERVRRTGNTTLRSIGDITLRQRLKDNNSEYVAPKAMLTELRDDNVTLVKALRESKAIIDEANDNATSGLIDGWTDQAEERAWFLFEATRTD